MNSIWLLALRGNSSHDTLSSGGTFESGGVSGLLGRCGREGTSKGRDARFVHYGIILMRWVILDNE